MRKCLELEKILPIVVGKEIPTTRSDLFVKNKAWRGQTTEEKPRKLLKLKKRPDTQEQCKAKIVIKINEGSKWAMDDFDDMHSHEFIISIKGDKYLI